jgi:hypothetical protein
VPGLVPDWKDASAYALLRRADRPAFAWEWLRRRADYRDAALAARTGEGGKEQSLEWNLHGFEDPACSVPLARPVWAAPRHRWVISARAEPAGSNDDDSLDIGDLAPFVTLVAAASVQRLLLSDGYRSIRADLAGAPLDRSPVRLAFELSGIRSLDRPLLVLRRFQSLATRHRFIDALYPPLGRARRLILQLRTYDALCAGANQADIAEALLSAGLQRRGWRVHSPSIRSQSQRLVRSALTMARGQFWQLLG